MKPARGNKGSLLSPEATAGLGRLELRARSIVEGFVSGLHKSPDHGFSVEFIEHKPYTAGDEIRNIDWRVFGRTDRFYIRQFEEETNTQVILVCDQSGSMDYAAKSRIASELTAALAWLAVGQNDAVGLVLAAEGKPVYLPPSSRPVQLRSIFRVLEGVKPATPGRLAEGIRLAVGRLKKRSLFVLISDLLDSGSLRESLEQVLFRGHELLIFRLEAPDEEEFPFRGMVKFVDCETGAAVTADAGVIRPRYIEQRNAFMKDLLVWSRKHGLDLVTVRTDRPAEEILRQYLVRRMGRTRA
jgi:uncharacterized protein (DUF58 family)